jgi:hypothetical protein
MLEKEEAQNHRREEKNISRGAAVATGAELVSPSLFDSYTCIICNFPITFGVHVLECCDNFSLT